MVSSRLLSRSGSIKPKPSFSWHPSSKLFVSASMKQYPCGCIEVTTPSQPLRCGCIDAVAVSRKQCLFLLLHRDNNLVEAISRQTLRCGFDTRRDCGLDEATTRLWPRCSYNEIVASMKPTRDCGLEADTTRSWNRCSHDEIVASRQPLLDCDLDAATTR